MRVRTTDNLSTLNSYITVTNGSCINGNSYNTASVGSVVVGDKRVTSDILTADYAKRRGKGEIIINPFVSVLQKGTSSVEGPTHQNPTCGGSGISSTYAYQPHYICQSSGVQLPFALFTPDDVQAAIKIASTKCWAAVDQEKTQLLVFLAELRRTISMLANPIGNYQRWLTKVRAIKNSSSRASDRLLTTSQYIAREWLTFRFGWLQLYRDIFNVVQALEKNEVTGLLRAFGNYSEERSTEENLTVSPTYTSTFNLYLYRRRTHKLHVRTGVYYMGSRTTNTYLGMTPEHVADTLWELIPYSFVVDWAVNVGSYLKGLIRHLGVPVKGSFTSITHTKMCVATFTGAVIRSPSSPHVIVKDAEGTCTWLNREKSRQPGVSSPSLALDLQLVSLIDQRVLDGLALVLNLAGRR